MFRIRFFDIIKCAFPFFIIFGSLSFTIITTLIGYQYEEGARIYVIYNVLIGLIGYACYAYHLLIKGSISLKKLRVIAIVALFIFEYIIAVLAGRSSTLASNFFIYMLVWSVPAGLYGLMFFETDGLSKLWKAVDVFMLLITGVVAINAVFYYTSGRVSESVSGATTYQTMSYLSALAIGINYYLLVNKNNPYRPQYFQKSLLYRVFCVVLLPIQTVSMVLTGGRGGMILTIVCFLVVTLTNNRSINKPLKAFVVAVSLVGTVVLLSSEDQMIVNGLERIFEFLGTDGSINWSGASGRDTLYLSAVDLISQKPINGYGVWALFGHIGNPHNIFLEWMLAGGVVGLLLGIIILVFAMRKYLCVQKANPHIAIILLIFLYDFVMLMFSGTYLCAPAFWFFLAVVFGGNGGEREKMGKYRNEPAEREK